MPQAKKLYCYLMFTGQYHLLKGKSVIPPVFFKRLNEYERNVFNSLTLLHLCL